MLISPFSLEAFHEIKCIGVPAWKVPSGRIKDHELLTRIAKTGRPVLLSTGMATLKEIGVSVVHFSPANVALLQCSSLYPCPPHQVGINVILKLRHCFSPEGFGLPVGLSDHSGTIFPSLIALHEGASVIEVHVVLDRGMYGFDTSSSITPSELAQIVAGAKFIPMMEFVDKNDLEPYQEARKVFM